MLELVRPAADVRADGLAFTLDVPPQEALAARSWTVAGVGVQARLLDAGHQVVAGELVETVAQLPGRDGPLPYKLHREVGGWSYGFSADVYKRDYVDFDRAVKFLRGYLDGRDDTVAGVFARDRDELSGVLVRQIRRGLEWRAWQTFPRTRQIVSTRTRMLIV
ncbi:DUF2617 family protein [Actinocorallia populi]|uniref:DUF2617 family protein n=1 Tax=Actinocorallia populi TaxID=2079200 RepID=UPI000D087124|nr:DUF2617 family protein [Actinocorallia populi]